MNARIQVDAYVARWAEGGHDLEATVSEIARLAELAQAVQAKSESLVAFRLIAVDTSLAKVRRLVGSCLSVLSVSVGRLVPDSSAMVAAWCP